MTDLRLDPTLSSVQALRDGVLAALAYLGVMYADMFITGSRSDDLLMLGRPITDNRVQARILGLFAHCGFGGCMGMLYAAIGRRRLRGPSWVRGVQMMLIENTVLWPLSFVADRYHPSMRSGELPRLNTPIPFLQQIVRHIAFGAVLGWLYGKGNSSK